jgi:hypothetical protein
MRRAAVALFLAPLLVSSMLGIGALVALPVMVGVSFAVALPLLCLLKRIERLEWWIALLAGGLCATCFIAVGTLLSFSFDIDRVIDSNNVFSVGLGAFTGLVFWWIGIFRNKEFPFVDRHFPIGVLIVLPIAAAGAYIDHSLEQTFYQGRVITMLAAPSANPRAGQASVRLTGGRVVRADLSNTWPTSMVLGRCVHLENRWSMLRMHRVYEVLGPFGNAGDDC